MRDQSRCIQLTKYIPVCMEGTDIQSRYRVLPPSLRDFPAEVAASQTGHTGSSP